MPYKKPKIEKVFYSISEAAEMFGVNTSNIRFWENEFDILKPQKNAKGNRLFTKDDIENLKLIHYLLKERGMTIKGAQKKLKENKEDTIQNVEVITKLQEIRQMLNEIKDEL